MLATTAVSERARGRGAAAALLCTVLTQKIVHSGSFSLALPCAAQVFIEPDVTLRCMLIRSNRGLRALQVKLVHFDV